jgi:hypothetical protein
MAQDGLVTADLKTAHNSAYAFQRLHDSVRLDQSAYGLVRTERSTHIFATLVFGKARGLFLVSDFSQRPSYAQNRYCSRY